MEHKGGHWYSKSMKMHYIFCGMPNDTSLAEAMSNSEKIKPVVLAVVELHLSEGIGQSVILALSQSVSQ